MNITVPDNANIQILVMQPGAGLDQTGGQTSHPLLAAPIAAAAPPRRSRRRDVLFVAVGAMMCVGVLAVVQAQTRPNPSSTAASRVALVTPDAAPNPMPAGPTRLPEAALLPPSPPDVDPREAVRRLLAARPSVTPAPGAAPADQPNPPSAPPTANPGKRNAFGMLD